MAEEYLFLVLGVAQRSEFLAESELSDHAPRQSGRATDVVGRTRRNFVRPEDQLFGDAAPKEARQHRLDLELGLAVLVALR